MKHCWTIPIRMVILCTLCVQLCLCSVIPVHAESEKAETASQMVARLQVQLADIKKQLTELQNENARLLGKLKESDKKLLQYKIQLSGIVSDESGRKVESKKLLLDLKKLAESNTKLVDKIEKLELLAERVTDSGLKQKFLELTAQLKAELKKGIAKNSIPAIKNQGRVLSVDTKLNALVFDLGTQEGVNEGSQWVIKDKNSVLAEIKVVIVRNNLSLAKVISGKVSKIKLGAAVIRKLIK